MFEYNKGCMPAELPGELPPDAIPEDADEEALQKVALELFVNLTSDSLAEGVYWRDFLSLTGQARTIYGRDKVFHLWKQCAELKSPRSFRSLYKRVVRPCKGSSWFLARIAFSTSHLPRATGNNTANVAIVPCSDGKWRIWMLSTLLENIEGYGHPDEPQMSLPRERPLVPQGLDYSVVIVGAGQSGLSLAGRLKALNIKCLLVEKGPSVGQAWTTKYDILHQHTIREYNNLPFGRTWNKDDPELLPGTIVAEGFGKFVDRYSLEVWLNSTIVSCQRDDKAEVWKLQISTKSGSESDHERTITCRHLGIAIGAGVSEPYQPFVKDAELFKGVAIHQSAYRNGLPFRGCRGVVVGTGTSGHDIAQSMLNDGLSSVTLIQRSATAIYPVGWLVEALKLLWNTEIPTSVSDRVGSTAPNMITSEIMKRNMREAAKSKEYIELCDGLEKATFHVDKQASMYEQIMTRYGGYYIDVGTCKHIIKGNIKVRSPVTVSAFTESGLQLSDETEVPADVVVFATGYEHDYRRQVAKIVGREIAGECGEYWGLDENGDIRGMMQENRQGLWMLGGTAPQARFTSRFVALMMQAKLLGLELGRSSPC